MSSFKMTRRGFLSTMGTLAAATALTPRRAHAQVMETPHVVVIHFNGGFNSIFSSADSFLAAGDFGVTANNIVQVGSSGIFVDAATIGALPAIALNKMSCIGVRTGISAHGPASMALWNDGSASNALKLAAAIPSASAIRCAAVGKGVPPGNNAQVGGVTLQRVTDQSSVLSLLGGTDTLMTDRSIAASALGGARVASAGRFAASPQQLVTLSDSYATAESALLQAPQTFDIPGLTAAYGLTTADDYRSFKWKLMTSELMIEAGASVMTVIDNGWDTHGDRDASTVRTAFAGHIQSPLATFLQRTLSMPNRNVVTVLVGEMARSLPSSNHQPNHTATVFGKYVQQGTTGHVDAQVALPVGTPGLTELWAYIAAAAKVSGQPFGANPHGLIL